MRRLFMLAAMLVALAFTLSGCQTAGTKADESKPVAKKQEKKEAKKEEKEEKAVKKAASGKGTIYYMVDDNVQADQREDKANAQKQMGVWMTKDLRGILKKRVKLDAVPIKNDSQFVSGPNSYLLKVKIVKYNPGSYAARTFVGYGAGGASMDISYVLTDSSGNTVLQNTDGVGSGRDWRNVARKLEENMAREIGLTIQ